MSQIAKQCVIIGVIVLEVALLVAALTALEAMSPPQAVAFESIADIAGIGFAPEALKASRTLTPCAYLPYISKQFSGTPKDVRVYPVPIDKYGPRVARHSDQVYAAWSGPPNYSFSDRTVSIASSIDGGWTWKQPVTTTGTLPAIAVDLNGNLHVSYQYSDTIHYMQCTNGGQTCTPPLSLGAGCAPDIAVDVSGDPYVVWQRRCSGPIGFTDIVLARPAVTITATVVATTTVGYSEPPKVAVSPSGQHVYVIWKCPPYYGPYVRTYFARSINGGNTFEPRFNPTGFIRHGEYSPDVGAFGEDIVYITWVLDQYGDRRTNFARSENSGESFPPRIELSQSGIDYDSTLAADTLGQVCVAWRQGSSMEVRDLYFRCSLDRGQNFLPARLLASGPPGTGQYSPALALWHSTDASYLDAVWQDERDDYAHIFFSSVPVIP